MTRHLQMFAVIEQGRYRHMQMRQSVSMDAQHLDELNWPPDTSCLLCAVLSINRQPPELRTR